MPTSRAPTADLNILHDRVVLAAGGPGQFESANPGHCCLYSLSVRPLRSRRKQRTPFFGNGACPLKRTSARRCAPIHSWCGETKIRVSRQSITIVWTLAVVAAARVDPREDPRRVVKYSSQGATRFRRKLSRPEGMPGPTCPQLGGN